MLNTLQTADDTNQNLYNMLEVPSMERSFMSGSSTDELYLQKLEGLEEAYQPGDCLYDELLTVNSLRSESSGAHILPDFLIQNENDEYKILIRIHLLPILIWLQFQN
ncbi:8106_t:CDS:1 [Acaulospora morrowiae]|uniref:8106_t:CDS:1 n=1 Tax=Acaulospora morrowiae TaxID=94023 RepID=A0A9N8VV03_9GLOM|nr:8106_t:CDS:1 [Acaulospora morrowiae]